MVFVREHGVELRVLEQLNGSARYVHRGTKVASAEGLRPRVPDHFDSGVSGQGIGRLKDSPEAPVRPELAPNPADGHCEHPGAEQSEHQEHRSRTVDPWIRELNPREHDLVRAGRSVVDRYERRD
jgi:hypothetical protein